MIVIIVQHIYYFLFHFPLKIVLRAKVYCLKNFKIERRPVIIASNHDSYADPFLLALLPYPIIRQLIPIYFVTSKYHYDKWWIRIVIRPMGSYPIRRWGWTLDSLLKPTITLLEKKKTVMIFPEGKIIRGNEKPKTKDGFNYLLKKTDGTILPMRITGLKDKTAMDVLRRRNIIIRLAKTIPITKKVTYFDILEKIYSM